MQETLWGHPLTMCLQTQIPVKGLAWRVFHSYVHSIIQMHPSARPPSLCHHCLVRCVPDSMLTYKAVAGTHTRHLQSWRTRLSLRLPWLGGVSYDWKDSKHLMKMYLCTTAASRSSPLLFKVNVQSKRKKEKKKQREHEVDVGQQMER